MSCLLMAFNRIGRVLAFLILVGGLPTAYAQLLASTYWQQPMARVVQKTSNYAAANSLALAYSSSVTTGNLLVVCASTSGTGTTISDSQSNDWILAVRETITGSSASCWYASRAKAGATTVTVDGASGFIVLSILEVSGMLSLDRASSASGSGTSISINTSATNDGNTYVLGYAHDWDNYSAWTAGSGFNMEVLADGNGSGYISALEGKMSRGPGVKNISFSKTPTGSWAGIALVFRATQNVPRLVQHTSSANPTGAVVATFASPVQAGSTLIACLTVEGGVTSLSDNINGSYSGLGSTGNLSCYVFFNAAAGTTTVTLVPDSSTYTALAIFEVAGSLTSCVPLESGFGNGTTSVSVISPSLPAPTGYFFTITGSYYNGPVFGNYSLTTPGWTLQEQAGLSGGKYRFVYADKDLKNGLPGGSHTVGFSSADTIDYFVANAYACK